METPKDYYYTYYSYEEYGRGYIGSRGCKCLPEKDVKYFGSSKDKNFKPTQKIILKDDYATREEAYADEIILQQYYKVVENLHFANKSYQTSTKFYVPTEQAVENGIKYGPLGREKCRELKIGIFGLTYQQRLEISKRNIEKQRKNKVAFFNSEFQSELGKRGAKKTNSQKWKCTETGFITNPGNLTQYQRARGIDTSNRIRLS
jgi:hypothetical protein